MSEWKEYKLGELCDFQSGTVFPNDYQGEISGDYPFIKVSDMNLPGNERIIRYANNWINEKTCRELRAKIHPKDATVFAKIGVALTYNRRRLLKQPSIIDNNMMSAIACDNVIPLFLYYLLCTLDFNDIASGTAVPYININDLKRIHVKIPPLPEQRAIASVLSSLDDKIDLLHRENKTLEAMAEALFQQWFIEEAKDEWEEKSLDNIANYLNGLTCQKYPAKNEVDKLPVLKIKELRNGFSDDSDWVASDVPPEYIVENGDVIFSWSGSLLVKIWDGEKCVLNQHLFKVTSENYPKWFYYFWTKYHLRRFIAIAESKATTMGHIKRTDLTTSVVLIPSKVEIESMDKKISPIIDRVIVNNRQIHTLEKLRDTLLPKLMSGEVRVKHIRKRRWRHVAHNRIRHRGFCHRVTDISRLSVHLWSGHRS